MTNHLEPLSDGSELAAEIVLTVVAMLRGMILVALRREPDGFERRMRAAKGALRSVLDVDEDCAGPIHAAMRLCKLPGSRMENASRAMLFIAAVEMLEEQAKGEK